jgi:hypothetical protein
MRKPPPPQKPRAELAPTGRYEKLISAADLRPMTLDELAGWTRIPRGQVHVYVKRAIQLAHQIAHAVNGSAAASKSAHAPIHAEAIGDSVKWTTVKLGDPKHAHLVSPTPAAPAKERRGGQPKRRKGSDARTRGATPARKSKATPRAPKVKPTSSGPALPNGTYCKLIDAASDWAKGHAIADAAKLPRPSTLVFLARAVERGWLEMRQPKPSDTPDYRSTKRGRERAQISRQLGG